MSQMVTRKGPLGEDKEKGQSTDTPVKEMKKKMAANAEKEKQAAEKHAEKDKDKDKDKLTEKQPDKAEEKKTAEKTVDKKEKPEKSSEKKEKHEKTAEKKEKHAEKDKGEKSVDKKSEAPAEKHKEDKTAKQPEKPESTDKDKETKEKDKKQKTTETPNNKPKQNGARANGLPGDAQHSDDATVSSDEELVIIDHERDDMFPELAYDDSDGEFEPPTPEGLPSRSYTRRSQAKAARTPETPRPASDRRERTEAAPADDSKEAKVLKLKDDVPATTDRKLRSADSPKPESRKTEKKAAEKEKEIAKEAEAPKTEKPSPKKKDLEILEVKDDESSEKSIVDMVIDLECDELAGAGEAGGAGAGARKDGTNYSRSRVKVSPYRRADQTATSTAANYTGNNTTMEMDITETSSFIEEAEAADSPYLSGLRSIRGRRSYKPLKEMALRNISVNRSVRSTTSVSVTEQPLRPTAPVVGRKRKPEGGEEDAPAPAGERVRGKRARLLDTLARPFRAVSTPVPLRRNAEIVGINTDLPLTAPVASAETFDPESLKASEATPVVIPPATPPAAGPERDRDGKRCSIM